MGSEIGNTKPVSYLLNRTPLITFGMVVLAVGLTMETQWAALALSAEAELPDLAAQRQAVQQQIALLQSDAPKAQKAMACRLLARWADKDAVPALVPLLADPELASWARIALEVIPGPEASAALREAMDRLEGRLLIGVINSLAVRRDIQAVGKLQKCLQDQDPDVAAAAAVALGRIGTSEAQTSLLAALKTEARLPVRDAIAEGLSVIAEGLFLAGRAKEAAAIYDTLRQAPLSKPRFCEATRGAILAQGPQAGLPLLKQLLQSKDPDDFALALQTARELGGDGVAKVLVEELAKYQSVASLPKRLLIIQKARYGKGDQWVDVTEKLSAAISNNTLKITASNELAGDPAPGIVKQLEITYQLGDQTRTVVVPEGQAIELGEATEPAHPRLVLLIYALGDLGNPVAREAILQTAKTGPWGARVAAIRVLGRVGDASVVPLLWQTVLQGGEPAQAAMESLQQLPGTQVDQALVDQLAQTKGPNRAKLLQLVTLRGIQQALPQVLADLQHEDRSIRLDALTALGRIAAQQHLDLLIKALLAAPDPEETQTAKNALIDACSRMTDREATAAKLLQALPTAAIDKQVALLEVAASMGGKNVLEALAQAARSQKDTLQDAATRLLGEWMSADAAPILQELATSGPTKYRIRALRAYLRIVRQLDLPIQERIALCREATTLCQRPEEKKLLLEIFRRYPTAETLHMAANYLADQAVQEEAVTTVLAIAEKLAPHQPQAVAEAMKQLLQLGKPEDALRRAKQLLQQVHKK
ncbi:MAG: HEAT repeat domain-containing protein [Thermoguttaceae bacterium]|nr:HEAT repeat domain-containing protein [Thermoguttaceae bacterium]MDW8038667.1 HEAT repeat domain-containing protein [Thermoguttaceae bacterium]